MKRLTRWLFVAALCLPLAAQSVVLNAPRDVAEYAQKTLFTAFGGRSPRTLDPQRSYSSDETAYTYGIYEPLYQYHYLKRPYALEPRTAERVVEPRYFDAQGKELPADAPAEAIAVSVYDIPIQKGIRFAPHPAFAKDKDGNFLYHDLSYEEAKTKRNPGDFAERGTRELTAHDYVHGIRRIASPRVVSPILGTMGDHIVGLEELARALREKDRLLREKEGADAYLDIDDVPFQGAEALDDHTLRIRVKGKYPQFSNWLTMAFFAPVPWEAEKFYSQRGLRENNFTLNTWPVGTGPFMMSVFEENRRHEMVKNPLFRFVPYPAKGSRATRKKAILMPAASPFRS